MKQLICLSLLLTSLLLTSGCANVPEDDIAFLSKHIPVGSDASYALDRIQRRGFTQIRIIVRPRWKADDVSKSFKQLPVSETDIAQQYIGFVAIEGTPDGELKCFSQKYTMFVAGGDRLICFTVGNGNKITWRQAGWRGASL